ncbi:MAG: response regulator transcription factor [Nitrospiraceae bacterium]|nr:MAG: response regulator transcription factor [Nitrospiraceae bacterium]
MIRVLIADDHPIVREGLRRFLAEARDIDAGDEAINGQEVLEQSRKKRYDVVLLDISMPGRSGMDILKQLRGEQPGTGILILSMHSEEEYAERAFKAGASGYLTKNASPAELVEAIRRVAAGGRYVSSRAAELLASHVGDRSEKLPHERLSDREYGILCMIASGKTVSEIAQELSLSKKTISTHRAHVLEKMGMKNNAQLICYALQNNLVP